MGHLQGNPVARVLRQVFWGIVTAAVGAFSRNLDIQPGPLATIVPSSLVPETTPEGMAGYWGALSEYWSSPPSPPSPTPHPSTIRNTTPPLFLITENSSRPRTVQLLAGDNRKNTGDTVSVYRSTIRGYRA